MRGLGSQVLASARICSQLMVPFWLRRRSIQYAAVSRLYHWPLGYWIARRSLSSGGHSADPLAGDDDWECGAVIA